MTQSELQTLLGRQREYFESGKTLPLKARLSAHKKLRAVLHAREADIYRAIKADLGKSQTETYMCELGLVYSELSYMEKHLRKFAKQRRVATPLAQFAARSYVKPCPRGLVLIMSPWNYPLLLTLDPLIEAIAAGNTVVLKPSAYAPETCRILQIIVDSAFDPGHVALICGGREENQQLLHQTFDYIFFTGSSNVGREVLKAAAPNLTPVSLELGGKSPCIVDETANLRLAARRIVFGKFLNCGQTCVAPDYICCQESVYPQLLAALRAEIIRQFGAEPLKNPDYGRIVNEKHFIRLKNLLSSSNIAYGGNTAGLQIEPTLVSPCSWEDSIMGEEIFGPLLPVITYRSLPELLAQINSRPHPLALYFFSENRKAQKLVTEVCPFGGGCINDTIIHLATANMGFGGVGASGMGAYHGKVGFDTFSHLKSMVDKKTWTDLPMRYQPYSGKALKLIRFFLK